MDTLADLPGQSNLKPQTQLPKSELSNLPGISKPQPQVQSLSSKANLNPNSINLKGNEFFGVVNLKTGQKTE